MAFFKKSINHINVRSYDILRSVFKNVDFLIAGICTKIKRSIPSFGRYWLPFWRFSKKTLHGPDLDNRYHFGCVSVFATKPIHQLNSAEAFMYNKTEKVKNYIFREFWPIFWYFSGTLPKIDRRVCSDWWHYIFQSNTYWYFYENVIFR